MNSIWISRYALSSGIKKVEPTNISGRMASYKENGCTCFAHGKDWWNSEQEARKRANEMVIAKIASLRAQITRLQRLSFASEADSVSDVTESDCGSVNPK